MQRKEAIDKLRSRLGLPSSAKPRKVINAAVRQLPGGGLVIDRITKVEASLRESKTSFVRNTLHNERDTLEGIRDEMVEHVLSERFTPAVGG